MKRVILMMAFAIGMTGAYAQKTVKVEKTENNTEKTAVSYSSEMGTNIITVMIAIWARLY